MKNFSALVIGRLRDVFRYRFTTGKVPQVPQQYQARKESNDAVPDIFQQRKLEQVVARIISLMEGDQLYKNPQLALKELSERLATPSYMVTRAMNEILKVNFYDLVNKYRVEEAKRLLVNSSYKRFTIMCVASDAGFNSKTTFNTVFKKFTGHTPSDYRSMNRVDQHRAMQAELVTR